MVKYAFSTAVVMICALSLRADLTELPAQFEARYGKELKTEPADKQNVIVREYQKNEIHVRVTFVGERAHHVLYFKPQGFFSLKEMHAILEANKGVSGAWTVILPNDKPEPRLKGDGRHWRRQDKAEAFADLARSGKKGDVDVKVKSLTLVTDRWLNTADNRF